MGTIFSRTMFAGLALVALTTGAAAQDRPRLLTSIEVRELAGGARAGDHARLRDHFVALADKYTTDARRYRALGSTVTGNPNHPPAVPLGARWTRAADQAEAAATVVRELSAHHGRLAAGRPSQAPAASERFEAGEGAPTPTEAQLGDLAANARTAAAHRSLAEYYTTLADKQTTSAQRYAALAQTYRAQARKGAGDPASHFDLMAKRSRELVNKARSEAAKQSQLAQVG
jgi:hypothetical protein